jgi:putative ATPase
LELNSIAFPAISTGIFGFPKERAAKIILKVFKDYFGEFPDTRLELVRLTLFDEESVAVYLQAADLEFNIPNNNQMIESAG